MSTDYDCWHEGHDDVTVEAVVAVIHANVARAKAIIAGVAPLIAAHEGPPPMHQAMKGAIMTAPHLIPADRRAALDLIIGKYL